MQPERRIVVASAAPFPIHNVIEGTCMERTLIIIKPHAVARGLAGEFLSRFERMGMRIAAIRVVKGDRSLVGAVSSVGGGVVSQCGRQDDR
jgi:hypothetical protein